MGSVYKDLEDNVRLDCKVKTPTGAWRLVRAFTRNIPFVTVTPTMIAEGAPNKYKTPMVLFAAPYHFELCQVRADGAPGLCILTVAIGA